LCRLLANQLHGKHDYLPLGIKQIDPFKFHWDGHILYRDEARKFYIGKLP
jgi:hypothetical protein